MLWSCNNYIVPYINERGYLPDDSKYDEDLWVCALRGMSVHNGAKRIASLPEYMRKLDSSFATRLLEGSSVWYLSTKLTLQGKLSLAVAAFASMGAIIFMHAITAIIVLAALAALCALCIYASSEPSNWNSASSLEMAP